MSESGGGACCFVVCSLSDGEFCCVPCPCTSSISLSHALSLDVCVGVCGRAGRASVRCCVQHFWCAFCAGQSRADVVGGHQTSPNSILIFIFVPLPVPFRSPSSSIQAQFVKISTVNPQMSLVPRTTNAAEPLTRIGIRISLPRQIWQAQSAILLYLFMGCMDESWMHGNYVGFTRPPALKGTVDGGVTATGVLSRERGNLITVASISAHLNVVIYRQHRQIFRACKNPALGNLITPPL